MGVIKNILLDKVQSLVDKRPFAFDPVAYADKLNSIQTIVASIIQNRKDVTLEPVTSSCSRPDLMEKNSSSVVTTQ